MVKIINDYFKEVKIDSILDIGTTKILCLVAEVRGSGDVEIIGVSSHPSKGLQRGIVLNIDSTVQSIRQAIEDAEKMAGTEITSVIVGICLLYTSPSPRD